MGEISRRWGRGVQESTVEKPVLTNDQRKKKEAHIGGW